MWYTLYYLLPSCSVGLMSPHRKPLYYSTKKKIWPPRKQEIFGKTLCLHCITARGDNLSSKKYYQSRGQEPKIEFFCFPFRKTYVSCRKVQTKCEDDYSFSLFFGETLNFFSICYRTHFLRMLLVPLAVFDRYHSNNIFKRHYNSDDKKSVVCYIRIRHKFQFWPESIEGFCF